MIHGLNGQLLGELSVTFTPDGTRAGVRTFHPMQFQPN